MSLLVQGKDWLSQCHDNMIQWDIMMLAAWYPSGAALECALSQVGTSLDMTLDVARM